MRKGKQVSYIYDLNKCKSYATKERVIKRVNELLEANSEYADRAFICRNDEGRWTAVISLDMSKGGYLCRYSQHGFMSI